MIAETISLDSALGLVLGRDDFVEISCQPVAQGCLHHLDTVLARTPKRLATFLIDHFRYLTKFTASLRTFGILGTFVYGIFLILALGVAKLMIHYGLLTFESKSVKYFIVSDSTERRDSNEDIDLFHFIVSRHEHSRGSRAGAAYGHDSQRERGGSAMFVTTNNKMKKINIFI